MPSSPADLTDAAQHFLAERHLATLATLRADGSPHVVAIGFTWDPESGIARVITSAGTAKALNAERRGRAALTQIDGARWLTLEGRSRVVRDSVSVRDAEERYARRYRQPRENPRRVVVEVLVDRVLGSGPLIDRSARR